MIERWVVVHDETGQVHEEAFASAQEAWKAQVELAREKNASPYEWTAHKVMVSVS